MIILPADESSGPRSPFKNEHGSEINFGLPEPVNDPAPPYSYQAAEPAYPVDLDEVVPAEERFWKSLAIALCIWFSLCILTRPIVWVAFPDAHVDDVALPAEHDGEILRCVYGSTWTHSPPKHPRHRITSIPHRVRSATTSFNLPTFTRLFFYTRGSLSQGSIEFILGNGTDIEVTVSAVYSSEEVFNRASVCLLRRPDNQAGIGIFTPAPITREDPHFRDTPGPIFKIKVAFPIPIAGSIPFPIAIPALYTDLPLFEHSVGDLAAAVDFHTISFRTTDKPVNVVSILGDSAEITTKKGVIMGSFNVRESLELSTGDGSISADIGLYNVKGDGPDITTLSLKSHTGSITSNISLLSPSPFLLAATINDHPDLSSSPSLNTKPHSSTNANFAIIANTSHGSIALHTPTFSPYAILALTALAFNGPANISLHPSYEGSFSLQSLTAAPVVEFHDPNVKDPAGGRRVRGTRHGPDGPNGISGSAFWWPRRSGRRSGNIKVASSYGVYIKV